MVKRFVLVWNECSWYYRCGSHAHHGVCASPLEVQDKRLPTCKYGKYDYIQVATRLRGRSESVAPQVTDATSMLPMHPAGVATRLLLIRS
jgi:hypothetical protein